MANEGSAIVPDVSPRPTIREMGRTTFSLLILSVVVVCLQPWLEASVPDEIRHKLLIRNGYITEMKPMFLFILQTAQKLAIFIAVVDTILNRRTFWGLFTSFGIYIGMGIAYLLVAQMDIPRHFFCAIVLIMSALGMLLYFKQFSKNQSSKAGWILHAFECLNTMFSGDKSFLLDHVVLTFGMVALWGVYLVNIIFLVVFLIQNRVAFF